MGCGISKYLIAVFMSGEVNRLNATRPAPQAYHTQQSEQDESADDPWSCNICLDAVKDPVVTQCGHLYCWPCLFRWLSTRKQTCPVCKAAVSRENVIPIFLGGSEQDPRTTERDVVGTRTSEEESSTPARPAGQRPDPVEMAAATLQANTEFGGVSFNGNFGFFPSLFGLQFQNFLPVSAGTGQTAAEQHEAFLSKTLVGLGSVVFVCFLK